eukprot:COSAG02_NODE_6571_length_3487_cov_73.113932_2_plen_57_part_00
MIEALWHTPGVSVTHAVITVSSFCRADHKTKIVLTQRTTVPDAGLMHPVWALRECE